MAQSLKQALLYTPPGFLYSRLKHYRKYGTNPSLTNHKDILSELDKNGIVVIENHFSPEQIANMQSETRPLVESVMRGTYQGKNAVYSSKEFGVHRLMEIDTVAPATKQFYEDEMINSVAKAFVSPKVVSYQRMVELKPDPTTKSIADDWHIDDWKHRFKAFLYLTDVGEDEAPFTLMPTSHKFGWWRFAKEFEFFTHPEHPRKGYFSDEEMENIQRKKNFTVRVCTGKAGTLILADTRALHRGTQLRNNERLMLVNYFDVRKL